MASRLGYPCRQDERFYVQSLDESADPPTFDCPPCQQNRLDVVVLTTAGTFELQHGYTDFATGNRITVTLTCSDLLSPVHCHGAETISSCGGTWSSFRLWRDNEIIETHRSPVDNSIVAETCDGWSYQWTIFLDTATDPLSDFFYLQVFLIVPDDNRGSGPGRVEFCNAWKIEPSTGRYVPGAQTFPPCTSSFSGTVSLAPDFPLSQSGGPNDSWYNIISAGPYSFEFSIV